LLDDLLNGFDLELATMLSGGLAHAIIIIAVTCPQESGQP
jgi:hypothetical protein